MPSITGFTSTRSLEIENAGIVSAAIVGGHIVFTRVDGTTFSGGDVRGPEQIPHTNVRTVNTPASTIGTNSTTFNDLQTPCIISGFQKYRSDTKLVYEYAGSILNDDPLGVYEVGVNLGGVTTVIAHGLFNVGQKSGIVERTGVAAGTYTIELMYRKIGTTGTVYDGQLAGHKTCLKVTETF